jgi:hypothetical protein
VSAEQELDAAMAAANDLVVFDDGFTWKPAPEIEPLYAPAAEARPRAPEDA